MHWGLAIVTFACLLTFLTNVHTTGRPMEVLTWVARGTFHAFLATLLPRLRGLVGLTERLWLTAVPVWFGAFAVTLLR